MDCSEAAYCESLVALGCFDFRVTIYRLILGPSFQTPSRPKQSPLNGGHRSQLLCQQHRNRFPALNTTGNLSSPTARFPVGSFRCLGLSAASRGVHRQVVVLTRSLAPGCTLPCHYLHNWVRKHITSQLNIWLIGTPPSVAVYDIRM